VVTTNLDEPAETAAVKPCNEAWAARHDPDRRTSAALPVPPKCWPATRRSPIDRRAPRHAERNSGRFD
jgi:hypothetical protein